MPIPTTKNLKYIQAKDPKLGEALSSHATAISNISAQLGADPNGSESTPTNVGSVNAVHLGNGLVDFAISDNSPRYRAISYFFEYRQRGNNTWRQVHTNSSRSPGPLMLPNGTYETRAYSQYINGGGASQPVNGPVVTVTGGIDAKLLESTGSGTAPSNGTRAGVGAGGLTSGEAPTLG